MYIVGRMFRTLGVFLLFSLFLTACESRDSTGPQFELCHVRDIVDGDTLLCSNDEKVRLLSVDAPEFTQEPFGEMARFELSSFAPIGSTVSLQFDKEKRDRYGRLLAYVYAQDVMLNLAMAERGYVVDLIYEPNTLFADEIRAAVARAKENKRGLWAMGGFDCLPYDHRKGNC